MNESDDKDRVLVLGSKPDAIFPDLVPRHIYTANAAMMLAQRYEGAETRLTAVLTSEFWDNPEYQAVFREAAPARVVVRRTKTRSEPLLRELFPASELILLTEAEQFAWQRRVLGNRIFLAEAYYKHRLKGQLRRLLTTAWQRKALGLSTGGYAMLLAAHENPEATVIVAGIGVRGGGHFMKHSGKQHGRRARVDAWMLQRLPQELKRRLVTTDCELAQDIGIALYNGS